MDKEEKAPAPLEHADYLKLPTAPTPGQVDAPQTKLEAGLPAITVGPPPAAPVEAHITVPTFTAANIEKLRFVCKSVIKRAADGTSEYCGGTLEDKPDVILANKDHRFSIKCPKCRAEFSRGMRFHIMSDQVKGVCELVLALSRANFGVEFIMKD